MSIAESRVLIRRLSALREPNPHIMEPVRLFMMKQQTMIIKIGNRHQSGKLQNSEPNIYITSFLTL
jgi:hypothetical protein